MAAFVWASAAAGNWSVGANWKVGGVAQANPPTTSDTVAFGAGTGFTQSNCTVDIAAVCSTITCTGYTATLTWSGSNGITASGGGTHIFVSGMGLSMGASGYLIFSGAGATVRPGAKTFAGTTSFTGGGSAAFATNAGTFNNLTITGTASKTDQFLFPGVTITVTGTLTLGGNTTQGVNRLLMGSNTVGTQRTLVCTGAAVVINGDVDFQDINITGSPSWTNAGSAFIGDALGNGGAVSSNTTTPATQTWSGTSGGAWSANAWSGRAPLPQDNVSLAVAFSASQSVTMDMPRLGNNISWNGCSGSPKWDTTTSLTTICYGNLDTTGLSTTTNQNSAAFQVAGRGAQTLTSGGALFTITFSVAAVTGSYTLQDAWTQSSGSFTVSTGSFLTGNQNMTRGPSGASTLQVASGATADFGTSTITLNGTQDTTIITFTAGATITASNATFIITSTKTTTRTIALGGFSIGTLTYTVAGSTGSLLFTGGGTIGTLNFSDVTNARTLQFTAGTTTTVTNFNVNGTSGKNMSVTSSTGGTTATLTSSSQQSSDYLTIQDITTNAKPWWFAGANSTFTSNVHGWILAAPQTYGYVSMPIDEDSAAAGTSYVATVKTNTVVGNTIVLGVKTSSGATISSITDTKGNTWTVGTQAGSLLANVCTAYCYLTSALTTSDTITVNMSVNATTSGFQGFEFTGIQPSSPPDQNAVAVVASPNGATITAGPTGSTTQAKEIAVSVVGQGNSAGVANAWVVSNGWTKVDSGTDVICMAFQTVNATGTFTNSWTGGSVNNGSSVIQTYKVAPPSGSPNLLLMGIG